MKRTSLAILTSAFLIISNLGVRVHADEVNSYTETAGVTPNDLTYGIDKFLEKISITFTFSDGSKIEKLIDIANERLAESQVMAEDEEAKLAEQALVDYNEALSEAQEKLQDIIEISKDEEVEEMETDVVEIQQEAEAAQESAEEALEEVQEMLPEESKDIVDEIKALQNVRKEAVRTMVEARHELNAAKKRYNASRVTLKKAEKAGEEAALKTAQEALLDAENVFNTEKTEYIAAFEAKQATIKETNEARKALVMQLEEQGNEDIPEDEAVSEEKETESVEQVTDDVDFEKSDAVESNEKTKEVKEKKQKVETKEKKNNGKGKGQNKEKSENSKGNKK